MPEVTLEFIAERLERIQYDLMLLRDDMNVVTAILNRVDRNQSSFIEELRAMRVQQERVRSRVDRLEPNPHP